MRIVKVFVDTSTVNRILDIKVQKSDDVWEEDREYLSKIFECYVEKGNVQLIVNPSVKREIENTVRPRRRKELLALFNNFHFTPHNKTMFPFVFPATFFIEGEKETMERLYRGIPSFSKDERIFVDAVFNSQIEVLLTTDRAHLANDVFRTRLKNGGLDTKIKVFTPRECFDYLQKEESLAS